MPNSLKKTPKKPKTPNWNPIDPLEVITVTKEHKIFLGNSEITEIEAKNLQQEAKVLKNFRIWKVLQETVRQKAVEKGVIESTDWEQTLSAKMMLHNLGILKSIVEVFVTYQPPVQPKMPPKK